jgi:divalent metal cation (Fe/Co/Zn/Cd) transporter
MIEEVRHAACEVPGVEEVSEVTARRLGHRLHAEVNVAVARSCRWPKGTP